jgi:N-acyl-D-aspartate/D-glutamate deacylase
MHLLIKDGLLVNGTGSLAIKSDLLIRDNKIVEIKQNTDSNGVNIQEY